MDDIRDATECWVCADTYTDPRILSCGHTFCLRCLTEIHKTLSLKEELSCPFCRQILNVPKDGGGLTVLPKNYSLMKLIEASRPSDPCEKHRSRSLEMYCVDCSTVICVRCLGDVHQLHQCCAIDKAADVYRQMIQGYALQFSGFASSARSHRRITTDRSMASLMSIERADIRVRERAKQLKQLIDRHATMLLCELDHQRQVAWMDVQVQFEKFLRHIEELERFKKFCNEVERYSSIELCRSVSHLENTAAELKQRHKAHIAGYVAGRSQPTETVFKDACIEEVFDSKRNNIVGRIEALVNEPLRTVKVTQSYESQLEDELTLQVGDIIDVIKQNDAERWQGILNGKIGMFPVNFVEVIDQLSEDQSVQLARVLYPYTAQNEDELDLVKDDTVTVLSDESASYAEGWLVGTVDGKMGVFPGNYVEIQETKSPEEDLDESDVVRTTPNLAAEVSTSVETSTVTTFDGLNPQNCLVVKQHIPDSENTDELHLCIGDVIRVLYRDSPYEGWWTGETEDSIGVFPRYCVQLLPPVTENHTTSPLSSPIENPPKSSSCPPTSTATPKDVGSTSDTTTGTGSSVEMDDMVKHNKNNVKEPGIEKTKDIGQPRDNRQPRDNGNGQPQDNGQPRDSGQPKDNGQPSTVMDQPLRLEAKAQSPKEDDLDEDLEVATTNETKLIRSEEEAIVKQANTREAMPSDATERSQVKYRPKSGGRQRHRLNTEGGPTGQPSTVHQQSADDVGCRSTIQPPLPNPSSSADSSATSIDKFRRNPGRRTNLRAKVVFDYDKQQEDELNLRVGDIITVLCQNLNDKGWWKGELNGNVGIFPENFVKLLRRDSTNVARSCASPELRTETSKRPTTSEANRRTFQVRIYTDDPQILRLSKGLRSSGKKSVVNS